MGPGKIFQKKSDFSKAVGAEQLGVIDDWHDHFALTKEAEGMIDDAFFDDMSSSIHIQSEGFGKNAQGVEVGMKSPIDHRRDQGFRLESDKMFFNDALPGSWFSSQEAQTALLSMNPEDLHDLLLVRHQNDVFLGIEGVSGKAEVSADHEEAPGFLGLRSLA